MTGAPAEARCSHATVRGVSLSAPGEEASRPSLVVGRYAVYGAIASGGMATAHFGRLLGPIGFSRVVAIKRLHPHHARDPEFVARFIEEARLAARIQHPNVTQTLDVVSAQGELFHVMEYVHGASLASLVAGAVARSSPASPRVVAAIGSGILQGLHAAHEARSTDGEPLDLVHRDVSPENVLVGADGIAKVGDFGIAKARGLPDTTGEGRVRGKLGYIAPEQLHGPATRASDVFATGVVLWEALAGERLFRGADDEETLRRLRAHAIPPLGERRPDVPAALEEVLRRSLERDPGARHATAREMALALEAAIPLATPLEVGAWVSAVSAAALEARAATVAAIESSVLTDPAPIPAGAAPAPPRAPLPEGEATAETALVDLPRARRETPALAVVEAEPPRRRGRAVAVAILLAAAAVGAPLALRDAPASVAATPAAPAPEPAAPPAAPTAAETIDPAPVASAPPATPARTSPPRAPRPGRAVASAARDTCVPPYRVGADGLRHYRPECF